MTISHKQRFWLNVSAVMVLLGLLISVALISLSPWYFFGLGRPPILKIGLLDSNDLSPSIKAAVEDINQSVRGLSPKPPFVHLYELTSKETVIEDFQRLYNKEEVRVFIAASKTSLDEVKTFVRENNADYSEAVIVSLITDIAATASEANDNVFIATADAKREAQGYLALIAANNPSNKTLDVVPVWENQPYVASFYDLYRMEAEARPDLNIRFTLPVTYEASKYPRSDGMQAVSEISSRLVLHPDAHILFLTSSRLREVIDASQMNKALTTVKSSNAGRRWYARGLVEDEAVLNDLEMSARDFAQHTSLTTLSFMASTDTLEAVEMLKRSMDRDLSLYRHQQLPPHRERKAASSAQTYLRAKAYSLVYSLHKSFTTSVLFQKSIKDTLKNDTTTTSEKDGTMVLASLAFHGKRPQILPLTNWMVSHLITFRNNPPTESDPMFDTSTNVTVEAVHTYPLPRKELQGLMGGGLERPSEECVRPRIRLWLHPSIIMPQVSLEFNDFNQIPEMMVLPAQKGISVTFECSAKASISAYCIPTKFNRGQLTCKLASEVGGPSIAASRSKRSAAAAIFENFKKDVKPLWSALTPDVFSCTASVAGCDFCMYYLGTYNLTAPPAACIGGCSLSTFGSCSKLVVNSFVKTFDLN